MAGGVSLAATDGALGQTTDVQVTCPAGRFIGERNDGVASFRGIRYGRAPRFRAPVAEPPVREIVRALAYGPVCPQNGKRRPQSEDCLVLNVWTPEPRAGARLPVMVYIHGGGYAFGSGGDAVTDGRHLARRGVVVVTLNHRLNALGYLYLARLSGAFPTAAMPVSSISCSPCAGYAKISLRSGATPHASPRLAIRVAGAR